MLAVYLHGFILSAAMILPLGPQNVFVMNQGIKRQHHLMSASLCALSDIILICAGIFGGSALLSRSPLLLAAWRGDGVASSATSVTQGRWRILVTLLAVTWLNPHVYLDTFVVLGSLGGQLLPDIRPWFALGAVTASIVWFFALAFLAAWLSPWLNRPVAQRIINLFVGGVMGFIAFQLARQGFGL